MSCISSQRCRRIERRHELLRSHARHVPRRNRNRLAEDPRNGDHRRPRNHPARPYAGAVGWFGLTGDLDFCITLRTIIVSGTKAYIQAGAGIVADSDRRLEHKECMNKSRAMLRAIEIAECSKE